LPFKKVLAEGGEFISLEKTYLANHPIFVVRGIRRLLSEKCSGNLFLAPVFAPSDGPTWLLMVPDSITVAFHIQDQVKLRSLIESGF
jgi:hypothetical protein